MPIVPGPARHRRGRLDRRVGGRAHLRVRALRARHQAGTIRTPLSFFSVISLDFVRMIICSRCVELRATLEAGRRGCVSDAPEGHTKRVSGTSVPSFRNSCEQKSGETPEHRFPTTKIILQIQTQCRKQDEPTIAPGMRMKERNRSFPTNGVVRPLATPSRQPQQQERRRSTVGPLPAPSLKPSRAKPRLRFGEAPGRRPAQQRAAPRCSTRGPAGAGPRTLSSRPARGRARSASSPSSTICQCHGQRRWVVEVEAPALRLAAPIPECLCP